MNELIVVENKQKSNSPELSLRRCLVFQVTVFVFLGLLTSAQFACAEENPISVFFGKPAEDIECLLGKTNRIIYRNNDNNKTNISRLSYYYHGSDQFSVYLKNGKSFFIGAWFDGDASVAKFLSRYEILEDHGWKLIENNIDGRKLYKSKCSNYYCLVFGGKPSLVAVSKSDDYEDDMSMLKFPLRPIESVTESVTGDRQTFGK